MLMADAPQLSYILTVVFNMFVHIVLSRKDLIDGSQERLQSQNEHCQLCDLWPNEKPGLTTTAYIDLFHYLSILLKAHSIYDHTED